MSVFSYLWSLVHKGVERKQARQAPRCQPVLEMREDRYTPSSLSGYVGPYPGHVFGGTPHVTVDLYEQTAAGLKLIQTTHTVASGAYSFTGLQPGVYAIEIPETVATLNPPISGGAAGTVNGQTDGVVGSSGRVVWFIDSISLGANEAGVNYDFDAPVVWSPGG
jgi:hypothetical protein